MTTKELGDFGEEIAYQFLLQKDYKILERNYRFGRNEIDLICSFEDKIIFVEVKTRQSSIIGEPWQAVKHGKQKQIIKCAHQYIISNEIDVEAQFDIISIIHNSFQTKIEHIDNAFYPLVSS